jgi:diacylglycerol kinase family enzyme
VAATGPTAPRRRTAAIATIALVALFVVLTLATLTVDLRRSLIALPLTLVAMAAAWFAITRAGTRKKIAIVVCAVAVLGVLLTGFLGGFWPVVFTLARAACVVFAVFLGRLALGRDVHTLKAAPVPGEPVPPARHGALIINPRSGDGKAERVGLVDACRERGIEPVLLEPGSDLRLLAIDAIDRGADVIGMAGGDGSQAQVASVAAERGVPMVVVPAGTRNHLAMDLGLDRNDVVGALAAYDDAVERQVDLGDVNGEVFVNNVSLGLYATIVRSPAYRDAKVDTTMTALQEALAPGTAAFELRYTDPVGVRHERAHMIQVSNGAYGQTLDGLTSRPRLDAHQLEIIALEITDDRRMASLVAAFAARHPDRHDGFQSWTASTFEVDAGSPIDMGLDGESRTIDPPLRFAIRDRPVRVRLPSSAIGYSPAGRSLTWRSAIRGVFEIAAGRDVPIESAEG